MGVNDTNVTLIPKVDNPTRMRDLRPLSLCNLVYKIVVKALANRLKPLLPSLISQGRSTFIPG